MKTNRGTPGTDCRTAAVKHLCSSETALFPIFAQADAQDARQRQADERARRITEHRHSMSVCWPEWSGPVAGGSGTNGFCEVHACGVHNLTHGETRYHYMAPCRIESVSLDGLTVIAVVEYDRPGWTRDRYNGERLRLDITEVWPPVWLLTARRRERQTPRPMDHAPAAV